MTAPATIQPAPPPPPPRRTLKWRKRRLWFVAERSIKQLLHRMPPISIELAIVFLIYMVPHIINSVFLFFQGQLPPSTHSWYSVYLLVMAKFPALVAVAFIAARAGVPRQRLGIARPNIGIDLLGAAGALCVIFALHWLLRKFLLAASPELLLYLLRESSTHFANAPTPPATIEIWLPTAIYYLFVGFSEEFLYRGYLLTRLRDWLGNRWLPLLISSTAFALSHLYQGYYGPVHSFVFGLAMGIIMMATRRLYIVAFAHAAWDFLLFTGFIM